MCDFPGFAWIKFFIMSMWISLCEVTPSNEGISHNHRNYNKCTLHQHDYYNIPYFSRTEMYLYWAIYLFIVQHKIIYVIYILAFVQFIGRDVYQTCITFIALYCPLIEVIRITGIPHILAHLDQCHDRYLHVRFPTRPPTQMVLGL